MLHRVAKVSSRHTTMKRHRPLARTRQRRILTKPLRPATNVQDDDDEEDFAPISNWRYFYYLMFAGTFWYFEYNQIAVFAVTVSACSWVGLLSKIHVFVRRSTNVHQIAGTVALRQRIYYYVDYWLSTFPYAKGVVLLSLTLALILTSGSLISYMADEPWVESLWAAALGSGLDWGFINSKSASLRFIAVCTNVGGLVVTALLLSLISDAVQTKYDSLRKGSSPVTESGHTLIIGWSLKTLSVMEQLAKASESKGKDTIVCLTDSKEKEEMEAEIASYDFKFGKLGTRVVCRSGSPLVYSELQRVSFSKARSIIILAGDRMDAEGNDAKSLHILMSIVASLEREKIFRNDFHDYERYAGPILKGIMNVSQVQKGDLAEDELISRERKVVIEVMDSDNAAIMASVSPGLVEPVMANDVVGRLMLQAARNPLVADVWQDLLGFDGCEPYATQWGILRGLRFKEVLLCFEDAIPLGIKTSLGEVILNPEDDYIIKQGDEIIVLAEDDDSYHASITHSLVRTRDRKTTTFGGTYGSTYGRFRLARQATGGMGLEAIRRLARTAQRQDVQIANHKGSAKEGSSPDAAERILFCGWRFDMGALLQVFCAVAPLGSEFWILSEMDLPSRHKELKMQGFDDSNTKARMKVVHRIGNCRRKALERLPLESFTGIIVGAEGTNSDRTHVGKEPNNISESMADADARVIAAVMMIQDLISKRESQKFAKVEEALPPHLAKVFSSSSEASRASSQQDMPRQSSMVFGPGRVSAISRRCVIVGEIVDSRSRAMLGMVNAIDAVVASNELVSKAIAMVSEDASVNKVLSNLFDPYGSEITLERAKTYVDVDNGELVSFFELMIRGREYGTIVLGYLDREEESSITPDSGSADATIKYTGVILNPGDKALRRTWHSDDLLIVLMSMEPRDKLDHSEDEPEDGIDAVSAQELNLSCPADLESDVWLEMPKKQLTKQSEGGSKRQISFAMQNLQNA